MSTRTGRVSFQVLQELYAVLTRKVEPAVSTSKAQSIVRDLESWKPAPIDRRILERAWSIEARYSVSWWDALILAAAQTCRCEVLLTEDLQHGQTFDTLRVIDPFVERDRTPAEILTAHRQ